MHPIEMLESGAALVLNLSGGKDSQAMFHHLLRQRQEKGWTGNVYTIHADLGESEWFCTRDFVSEFSRFYDVPIHVVKHNKYESLIEGFERRWEDLVRQGRTHVAPWSSSAARYCTSDYKRAPISKWINGTFREGLVVSAMGLRKEESTARSKKSEYQWRTGCLRKSRLVRGDMKMGRYVADWNPILDWTEEDVWNEIETYIGGTLGYYRREWMIAQADGYTLQDYIGMLQKREVRLPFHPAYMVGNKRLSCALCILANEQDIMNGVVHHPKLYNRYCRLEMRSNKSFRKNLWLTSMRPELLDQEIYIWGIQNKILLQK